MRTPPLKKGEKRNNLLMLELVNKKPRKWRCLCACGKEKVIYENNIKSGTSKSCGCLTAEWVSKRKRGIRNGQKGWLYVKPTLAADCLYYGQTEVFEEPFICIVISEYTNSCAVRILETFSSSDGKVAAEKSYRTIVPKKNITKYVMDDE